jgi:hypothetical protein
LSDEREARVGLNEALFREVNEQIRSLADDADTRHETITVICECADTDCTERIELRLADYERIRDESVLYIVATGHEVREAEVTIEQHDGWEVVRKIGVAGEVAEETDPRA